MHLLRHLSASNHRKLVHTFAARAIALDASRSLSAVCVVNMQNLVLSMKLKRSSTFSFKDGSSRFFWVYGSAGALPVSVLLKDDIMDCV